MTTENSKVIGRRDACTINNLRMGIKRVMSPIMPAIISAFKTTGMGNKLLIALFELFKFVGLIVVLCIGCFVVSYFGMQLIYWLGIARNYVSNPEFTMAGVSLWVDQAPLEQKVLMVVAGADVFLVILISAIVCFALYTLAKILCVLGSEAVESEGGEK